MVMPGQAARRENGEVGSTAPAGEQLPPVERKAVKHKNAIGAGHVITRPAPMAGIT